MKVINVTLLVYGVFLTVMGVLGYVEKHHIVSLVAGVISGMLILASVALAKTNPRAGRIMALVVSALLFLQFFGAFVMKQQLYPAGIIATFSLIVVLMLGAGHMLVMRKKRLAGDN